MKLLLENWRKLLEGEVVDLFPRVEREWKKWIRRVITFEDRVGELLGELYGNQYEIPVEVIEQLEALVTSVEESFKE